LNFKHLFSAEIVPFKQAYIERNFHPPLLFRDVAELKDRVAYVSQYFHFLLPFDFAPSRTEHTANQRSQTAYGATEKIPKNADILIAGFACVDFSVLNNHRKTLDEKGESGGTFWGIVRYAMTYRPRLVILENVKSAPWEKIAKHWNEIDYFAIRADVDTKAYYLPQTRERVYMFCVDKRLMDGNGLSEADMRAWTDVLAKFKRPASSPAGMFLMDVDDRRLEQIEREMAMKITSSASSARATVNWAKYQVRHQNYRLSQGLGHRRPVSKSQDDGTCRMPDFAWQTWVKSLPERVWDTIDVNFLRKLAEGCDMNYKE
jgi:site-specific DNA-cytosine methylase